MLWLVPFVSPDSATFRELQARRPAGAAARRRGRRAPVVERLQRDPGRHPPGRGRLAHAASWTRCATGTGWTGSSSTPATCVTTGSTTSPRPWPPRPASARPGPGSACSYPFNEYRACWKMGGTPLAQRLHDKPATWDGHGLASLIPESIAQGLIGHPFVLPGHDRRRRSRRRRHRRSTRNCSSATPSCAALHPMMQFSLAPHRVLDPEPPGRRPAGRRPAAVPAARPGPHDRDAARTGEPILRSLAYDDPTDPGTGDQFTLGGRILVAPVLHPGRDHPAGSLPSRHLDRPRRNPLRRARRADRSGHPDHDPLVPT